VPAKSKAQFRFFKALENNPELRKKHNISKEEAEEYTKDNKGKKRFSKLREYVSKKAK